MLLYFVILLSVLAVLLTWHVLSPETRSRKKRQKVYRKPITRSRRPSVQLFTRIH